MVSIEHESLVEAIKRRPEIVLDMARKNGIKLPRYSQVTVGDSNLTVAVPPEFRCDIVLFLKRNDKIVMAFVV
ncbi:MAG: hypothetical protein FWD57_02345, partial [Polyangiaceae bacterium]|nr:hypothetical protein [Polyangiaceae bacterium]